MAFHGAIVDLKFDLLKFPIGQSAEVSFLRQVLSEYSYAILMRHPTVTNSAISVFLQLLRLQKTRQVAIFNSARHSFGYTENFFSGVDKVP